MLICSILVKKLKVSTASNIRVAKCKSQRRQQRKGKAGSGCKDPRETVPNCACGFSFTLKAWCPPFPTCTGRSSAVTYLPASRGEVESWAARLARLSGKSTSGKWGLLASHFLGAGKKSVQLETYPPLTGSQFQAFCLGLYHLDSSESRLWNSVGHLNGPCLSIPGFPARRICSAEFGKGEWNYWNHLRVMVVEQGRRDLESRPSMTWPNCLLSLEFIFLLCVTTKFLGSTGHISLLIGVLN